MPIMRKVREVVLIKVVFIFSLDRAKSPCSRSNHWRTRPTHGHLWHAEDSSGCHWLSSIRWWPAWHADRWILAYSSKNCRKGWFKKCKGKIKFVSKSLLTFGFSFLLTYCTRVTYSKEMREWSKWLLTRLY